MELIKATAMFLVFCALTVAWGKLAGVSLGMQDVFNMIAFYALIRTFEKREGEKQ